jgi:hypothetical protein
MNKLPEGTRQPEKSVYVTDLPDNLGIAIPSAVSYATLSYDMSDSEYRMSGQMGVASTIISLAQLWNEIRVQGGAYGASMSAGRTGGLFCYTYRDPSPERSLGIYKTIPEFLKNFAAEEGMDPSGFIISSIAATDPLLSPAAKGRRADDFYFSGFTDYDRVRFRREMLETDADGLAYQYSALEKMAENGNICVAGPREVLENCPGLTIVDL